MRVATCARLSSFRCIAEGEGEKGRELCAEPVKIDCLRTGSIGASHRHRRRRRRHRRRRRRRRRDRCRRDFPSISVS